MSCSTCCSTKAPDEVIPENLAEEIHVAESLLKGKKLLTESTTKCLNKLNENLVQIRSPNRRRLRAVWTTKIE